MRPEGHDICRIFHTDNLALLLPYFVIKSKKLKYLQVTITYLKLGECVGFKIGKSVTLSR